ncbi:MAG: PhnD/SsuA/transferrin family substrate-binding protein [Halothiobacillaceae bacterium]
MLERVAPEITGLTRIVCRSPYYGFPPIVARATLEPKTQEALMAVFTGMSLKTEGQAILATLGLNGFARVDVGAYDDIRKVVRALGGWA